MRACVYAHMIARAHKCTHTHTHVVRAHACTRVFVRAYVWMGITFFQRTCTPVYDVSFIMGHCSQLMLIITNKAIYDVNNCRICFVVMFYYICFTTYACTNNVVINADRPTSTSVTRFLNRTELEKATRGTKLTTR